MAWKTKDKKEAIPEKVEELKKENKQEYGEAVVPELPQIPARQVKGEDGKVYNLITQNEAVQEILEGVRELLKRTEE